MKKLLIGLILTCSSTVNAQQVNAETGNIVYTTVNPPPPGSPHTWTGFINSSTNGGGLSGGNTPAYNPTTGTFIFGYTQRTVAYTQAVNFALANAGTGVQVGGFKYSWEYFNQDFSRGTLTGNISLTNSGGSVIQSYNYSMPRTTSGWTTMSGTQNFNTQYAPNTLGNINVSFTGKDDRFWAGYYGPQIRDIDVRFLYTVPPPIPEFSRWIKLTDENGTFTLSKTGVVRYGAQGTYDYKTLEPGTYSCSNGAWGKDPIGGVYKACDVGSNAPPPSPLPTTTTNTTTTTNNTVTTFTEPTTTASTTTTTNPVIDSTTSTAISAPTSPVVSSSSTSQTTSTTSTTNTTTAAVTPVATVTTTPSSSNTRSVDGTGIGLSLVARNAQREQAIAMQAAQSAIAATEQTAQQAQQEAVSVAQTSSVASMATSVGSSSRFNLTVQRSEQSASQSVSTSTAASSVSLFAQPGAQVQTTRTSDAARLSSTGNSVQDSVITQTSTANIFVQEQSASVQTQSSFTLLPPQQQIQQTTTQPISFFTNEVQQTNQMPVAVNQQSIFTPIESSGSEQQKLLTDKSNPINQILESKPELQSSQTVQQKTTVNMNASDNEIAGGVGLARMATTPPGYNQYLNLIIADASFYAPKEIYRGQRTVDNVRALRAMSSDRLHQQMVDSQYERK